MKIKFCCYLLIAALLSCFCMNAFAAGAIDMAKTGSIVVSIEYHDEAVSGGTLTLYHVAEPVWMNGEYVFEFTQQFEDCDLSLTQLDHQEIANQYAEYATMHSLSGTTRKIDMNGQAEFKKLPLGLYLVVQKDAAAGYFPITPFLITVPISDGDEWVYDVDATPKIDIEREPQPENPPIKPNIPQTGQLKWPIPVLTISGIVFFALGWILCFRRRNKKDEA